MQERSNAAYVHDTRLLLQGCCLHQSLVNQIKYLTTQMLLLLWYFPPTTLGCTRLTILATGKIKAAKI